MLWYSLEVLHEGTSNEYSQHLFLWRKWKNIFPIPVLIWSYVIAILLFSDQPALNADFFHMTFCLSLFRFHEEIQYNFVAYMGMLCCFKDAFV